MYYYRNTKTDFSSPLLKPFKMWLLRQLWVVLMAIPDILEAEVELQLPSSPGNLARPCVKIKRAGVPYLRGRVPAEHG